MTQFKRSSPSKFSSNTQSNSSPVVTPTQRQPRQTGKKDYAFNTIGSITVPKSATAEMRDIVHNELKGSEIKLTVKVYPPKGVDSITLNRDDLLLLTFNVNEKDPEFVVGKMLLPTNS